MDKSTVLTDKIDQDEGLKAKRKLLTITSLILLALSFSGAVIDEANTFLFKITFKNQHGLGILLVLSIIFLMIRYYNYAKPYHDKLYDLWTHRLTRKRFFYSSDPYSDEDDGIIAESRCSELDARLQHDIRRWDYKYVCGTLPFTRYIVHFWGDNDHEEEDRMDTINILTKFGLMIYLHSLYLEGIEQISSYLNHRENLDILAPYLLGYLSIASFYFNTELMDVLLFLSPSTSN